MPCFLHAADSSFMGSRLNGVASWMFQGVTFVGHMQKPSWCLLVMTMYRIPAERATPAHASASNFVGLNWPANFSYSGIGIFMLCMIHSPICGVVLPLYSPAGTA